MEIKLILRNFSIYKLISKIFLKTLQYPIYLYKIKKLIGSTYIQETYTNYQQSTTSV